jgi:Tfp pilus assembly protein PilF
MPVKVLWNWLFVAITLAALGGCAADSVKDVVQSKGQRELATGMQNYENGKYSEASKALQSALDSGLNSSDQVTAHKYLAFIYCTSAREKQCRDEFGKALDIDPALELEPAESGHPTWGPVFRSLKARR